MLKPYFLEFEIQFNIERPSRKSHRNRVVVIAGDIVYPLVGNGIMNVKSIINLYS